MTGRTLEKLIILPLDPALLQRLELGKHTIADLKISAVLLTALINILREHAVIGECQTCKCRQTENAPEDSARE